MRRLRDLGLSALLLFLPVLLPALAAAAEETKRFAVAIADRQVAAGGPVIRVTEGDLVAVTWTSDEDGTLHSRTWFAVGLRTGESAGWWQDGSLMFIRHYDEGLLEGEAIEWYENGQERYRQNFHRGREQGLQQGWLEDGTSAFAYEYRDGRRFGVLGSKPCYTSSTASVIAFNEKS